MDVYLIKNSSIIKVLTAAISIDPIPHVQPSDYPDSGVVIDPTTNTAVIGEPMEVKGGGGAEGYQFLNLSDDTLGSKLKPQVSGHTTFTSPGFVLDTMLQLLLSAEPLPDPPLDPAGALWFQIYKLATTPKLYNSQIGKASDLNAGGLPDIEELDSTSVDCTTGIAVAGIELKRFPGGLTPPDMGVALVDIGHASFTDGIGAAPGTFTAPHQIQKLPDLCPSIVGFDCPTHFNQNVGPTEVVVAPGTHLGLIVDESDRGIAAFRLPATSESVTPAILDYAVASIPDVLPDGTMWINNGNDPHPLTAYVSPNGGKAFGLLADTADANTHIAKVDLQALLDAKRLPGSHVVDPTVDLVAAGILTFTPAY